MKAVLTRGRPEAEHRAARERHGFALPAAGIYVLGAVLLYWLALVGSAGRPPREYRWSAGYPGPTGKGTTALDSGSDLG